MMRQDGERPDPTRRSVLRLGGAAGLIASMPAGALVGRSADPARSSSRDRLDSALARIADPAGEGPRTYLTLYTKTAREAAAAADKRARRGDSLGALDGVIVSIKDLFDVAGEPTRAGSPILANAPPARADALVLQRLRKAGAVIIGKTNMVEFAFSGVGANPHYGTPANPADRVRVPGGSTSGGGAAVGYDMCAIAIGTDTGGSTRIPAALCGVVGFKPSKYRVPTQGAFPLAPSLDSVGPIARSVQACADADAVLAGGRTTPLQAASLLGLRFAMPQGPLMRDMDDVVGSRFADATARLGRAGIRLSDRPLPMLDDMAKVNAAAPLGSVEAWRIHRDMVARFGPRYDPLVLSRIEAGRVVTAAGYATMLAERRRLIGVMDAMMADIDALILPTTAIVAPTISEIADFATLTSTNRLLLRNTAMVNFFDLCAISIPIPGPGLPVGLMLVARNGQDRRLLQVAQAVERLLAG